MGHFAILGEFAWCNTPETVPEVVSPSFYPLAMPYQEMLDRLYKVKEWRVDYLLNYERIFPGGMIETGNAEGHILLPSQLSDESEFACNGTFAAYEAESEAGEWTRTDETGGLIEATVALQYLSFEHYQTTPSGVAPSMVFDLAFTAGTGTFYPLYLLSSWRNGGGDGANEEQEVDFAGLPLKCWKPPISGMTYEVECSISVSQYWPYA